MGVFVIAEVGPNHNGSLDLALRYVDELASSGADAVKFQLAVPENVYSDDAFKADYQVKNDGAGSPIEMSRRVQLPSAEHVKLYEACRARDVAYMCTAFDLDSLRFLDENFDLPYFKIASGEILSLDMLEYIAARDRPIILSTGMAVDDEIAASLDVLERGGRKDVTLLHCVSNYPAPHADINLRAMYSLGERFARPVGYSDHSLGAECCLGAVALGATVIEKHVTLDRSMPGPDHKASATIDQFTEMVASIRLMESALGQAEKTFSAAEASIRGMARKSIVAAEDIAAGQVIERRHLCFKRPGNGLSPLEIDRVLGATAAVDIAANRVIRLEHLQS